MKTHELKQWSNQHPKIHHHQHPLPPTSTTIVATPTYESHHCCTPYTTTSHPHQQNSGQTHKPISTKIRSNQTHKHKSNHKPIKRTQTHQTWIWKYSYPWPHEWLVGGERATSLAMVAFERERDREREREAEEIGEV